VGPRNSNPSSRRVVEEPKGSPIPYLVLAVIAAVAAWTWLQDANWDFTRFFRRTATIQQSETRTLPTRRDDGPHGAKGDLRQLFSADDYPAAAARNGEEGIVQAELDVSATGRVTACAVVRSSGSASLDSGTCQILQRRARFIPARDVNGNAVSDQVTTPPVVWRLEG
jgi:TonB family protein